MSLVNEQWAFLQDVTELILYAREQGFVLTGGELSRTAEQQAIYLKTGKSETANSMHLKRLAIDLNVFKNGELCTVEQIKPLGEFWKSLNPKNRWGGDWKNLRDGPHFERNS